MGMVFAFPSVCECSCGPEVMMAASKGAPSVIGALLRVVSHCAVTGEGQNKGGKLRGNFD